MKKQGARIDMKQFGFLCIFVSLLSAGFGVYLIVSSAMSFVPELISIFRIAVGIIWLFLGVAMFVASIRLITLESRANNFDEKENNDER